MACPACYTLQANVLCCACGGGWHGSEGTMPTSFPTLKPTGRPSIPPTTQPSAQPTPTPSSSRPTPQPTRRPAKPKPTRKPTPMPTPVPTPKPTRPSEHLIPGGTCKVTNKCFHYACDDWIDYDPSKYTCEALEKQGCDCSGCSCHHPVSIWHILFSFFDFLTRRSKFLFALTRLSSPHPPASPNLASPRLRNLASLSPWHTPHVELG